MFNLKNEKEWSNIHRNVHYVYCIVLGRPSKLLGIYNSPALIILGLSLMGFGCGMIIIPVMPDMIESVEEKHPRWRKMTYVIIIYQGYLLHSKVSTKLQD